MTASGRKRKSESRNPSVFDVRYTPGSGRWADIMLRGRFVPDIDEPQSERRSRVSDYRNSVQKLEKLALRVHALGNELKGLG